MTAAVNHTIVPATDKRASAEFLRKVLGIDAAAPWGPFIVLSLANGVTLDFVDATSFEEHHYAFLVDESEFDAIFERVRAADVRFYADRYLVSEHG